MAKRRVTGGEEAGRRPRRSRSGPAPADAAARLTGIAVALLAAAVVYVSYHPADSVAVERGHALWVTFLCVALATLTFARPRDAAGEAALVDAADATDTGECCRAAGGLLRWSDRLLDLLPWILAGWIMIAAFATSPPGNLRMATNEAWIWVAMAATFTAARRLMVGRRVAGGMLVLVVVCSVGLAVHGLHQQIVSLPRMRAEYREDPEAVMRQAGIDAPPGSAERMVFENRLRDGGPTGTFALANSLAAFLVMGLVVSVGWLSDRWGRLRPAGRWSWFIAAAICGVALLGTRSRSGLLAALVGIAAGVLLTKGRRLVGPRRRIVAGGVGVVALTAVAAGLAVLGNPEWYEQAPASLAFRFQYWRATLAMVADRPLFAAGPGNFQSIYERYREAGTSEQIAEPHNFLFETLASGGVLGVVLLLGLLASAGIVTAARRGGWVRLAGEASLLRWIPLGGGASLAAVWVLGAAIGQLPDIEAHLVAVPAAIFAAVALVRYGWTPPAAETVDHEAVETKGPSASAGSAAAPFDEDSGKSPRRTVSSPRAVAVAGLAAVLVHLTASGGWTVAGVTIPLWVLAAIAAGPPCRGTVDGKTVGRRQSSGSGGGPPAWRQLRSAAAVAVGGGLLLSLYWFSIGPVEDRRLALLRAEYAQSRGRMLEAQEELRAAMRVDPWAVDSALWLADSLRWQLVAVGDRPPLRRRWLAAIEEVRRRGGDTPSLYRELGEQQIHVYQRYGRPEDLQAAMDSFSAAARWSPAHLWLAAQRSVLAAALGRRELSDEAAAKALRLSRMGDNIERDLKRQLVYVAEVVGPPAAGAPLRRPASKLLANRSGTADVTTPAGRGR